MARYLLDTNICISLFKNKFGIRSKIAQVGIENCFVSEITIAELFYGAYKGGRQRHFDDVQNILQMFGVMPIYPCLELYGEIRFKLERKGRRLDDLDMLIGATAVYNNMVMVSSNIKHFERIPSIVLENWCDNNS